MAAQNPHPKKSHPFRLSVIIPTLNEAGGIAATLAQVLAQAVDIQVIVVDGGSTDGTAEIVAAFPEVFFLQTASPGRALQFNAGAQMAEAALLFFMHADTRLPERALATVLAVFEDPGVKAGSFYLRFDRERWIYRCLSLLSRFNHLLTTYGDQGLFVRRQDFLAIGGFPAIPICEDLAIQRSLRKRGRFVKVQQAVITSARRFEQEGPWRQTIKNSWIVAAYLLGIAPGKLKRWYPPYRQSA